MRKQMDYKNCTVEKGQTRKTVWVPTEVARVGTVVEINRDGGWVICALSGIVYPLELALAQSTDPVAKVATQ
jgi:hypothetical protein